MKITSSFNRYLLSNKLMGTASQPPRKRAIKTSRNLFLSSPSVSSPSYLPWIDRSLRQLQWGNLRSAYQTGVSGERTPKERESAMLEVINQALVAQRSIELMMVSFTKG